MTMRRIAILLALGFFVLSAATYLGVYLGEREARGNRSEYLARKLIKDYQREGSLPEVLSDTQRQVFESHRERVGGAFRRIARELRGDVWYFDFCFESGAHAAMVVPEDGDVSRFEITIDTPESGGNPCRPGEG